MKTLWITCKNVYCTEAHDCWNQSWNGFSPRWPVICSFKQQFSWNHLPHKVHFYSAFWNWVSSPPVWETFPYSTIWLYLNYFLTLGALVNTFHATNVKKQTYRNRWQPYEPHARMHVGEKHILVQISPDVVFLQGGQSYAPLSDSSNGTICHTGYIFAKPSEIRCLCPQCGKLVLVQHWTLPKSFWHRAHSVNIFHVTIVETWSIWMITLQTTCKNASAHSYWIEAHGCSWSECRFLIGQDSQSLIG